MVVLNRIYTRTGDAGTTALASGERVAKDSLRVEAYGTIDETNATVGMARIHAADEMAARLGAIQNDLFDVGADLAQTGVADVNERGRPVLRAVASQVARLEAEIDAMNAGLAPLRSFILPGGSVLSAHLHICRTVCRRAERLAVRLAASEAVSPEALRYLNRLSDWFFVAARTANPGGDILWVPGANR